MSLNERELERRVEERAEQLAASRTEHHRAEKLKAVGRLAGGVAHDFNNLLTGILGVVQNVRAGLGEDSPHRKDLDDVIAAAGRASHITRQLLAFGRRQVMAPKAVALNRLILSAKPLARRLLGPSIKLRLALDPGLGNVRADEGSLEQAILSLCLNAREAMPAGGELEIRTAPLAVGPEEAKAREIPPGSCAAVTISDTGPGLEPEELAHLFEPFLSAKGEGKSGGLGLASAYGIVKQNGGDISVESERGRGTTFRIYLPRTRQAAPVLSRRSSDRPPPDRGGETVLLTEDEDIVRKMIVATLKRHGYDVLEARDAREARDLSAQRPGHIHLLLTDVVMPGMNGRDLAAALTARRPELKVLYMSGYDAEIVVERGILPAGTDFIEKSFTPESLCRKVRAVLDAPARQFSLFPGV